MIICALLVPGDVTWDRQIVIRHYQAWPQSLFLYQAVKLYQPQALWQYYAAHPQWSYSNKEKWLSQPALANTAQSHYHKGLNRYHNESKSDSVQLRDALSWLKSGWHKGSVPAALLYSRLLAEQGAHSDAKKVLLSAELKNHPDAQLALARVMLQDNQMAQARSLLSEQSGREAQLLLAELDKLLNLPMSVATNLHKTSECLLHLQPVVAGYHELRFTADMIRRWSTDPSMNDLPVCFGRPLLFDPARFGCEDTIDAKLQCDLTLLADTVVLAEDVTPLLIYGEAGVANYNNGIVYLNRHKGYGVFRHELFHHLGFMDEYALPQTVADRVCHQAGVQNLLFVAQGQPIDQRQAQLHWPGEELALTAVSTCDGTAIVAYKPVAQLTLMEFMDQSMPQLYIRRAKHKLLQQRFDLANYQYGYALAHDNNGDRQGYLHWLRLSAAQGYRVAGDLLQQEAQ